MAIKRTIKRSSDADEVMLFEAFDEFILEKKANNLSESTIKNYRQSFDFFCKFSGFDDNTSFESISNQDIYKWINSLKLSGISASSINHYLRDIKAFLYWCMDPDRSYLQSFKIKQLEHQEEKLKLFTDEEIEALLEKPRKKDSFADWRTWTIVNWVLATGNRASTICDVQIKDINFTRKEITLGHTKNKKAQNVPMSSSLSTVLKEYIRMWRKDADPDSYLFCNVGESKLTTNALRLSFGRYCDSRGVDKSNIHGLRHNFAKGWVRNNGNMFVLQKILGHSTLDMTRRYVKLFSEDIKEDYDKFSPLDTIKRSAKRTKAVERNLED